MPGQTEEAFEFLIQHLAQIPHRAGTQHLVNTFYGHIKIPELAFHFWRARIPTLSAADMTDDQFIPLYDAAWELARIGVLRPGRVAPRGAAHPQDFGDVWSITDFGFSWLSEAAKRPFLDMSRISEIFAGFVPTFGPGFGQRAVESVRTYRTNNYLAACVMAGAAAESILLAVANAKTGDEKKTLKMYEAAGGRSRVTAFVVGQSTSSVKRQFEAALHILHYWRDDAAHGAQTSISEIEAYAAINELLRLAQFTSDQWTALTT